jgi:ABC-type antimicrobial peptide transport system permease subunit
MAAVGVYGVLHHSVSRRSKEIGVRVALGAHPLNVERMVIREGLTLALPGIAVGVLGALWVGDVLASLLYRVSSTDATSIVMTALTLTAATLVASYLPARRAARVDPNQALRGD